MPGKNKDIPEQEFELIENSEESIMYEHPDGTVVFAEQTQDGWDVGAAATGQSGVTELAQTDSVDDAIDVMTQYMADYESPDGDSGGMNGDGGMGDDMDGDAGGGLLAGLGSAAAGIASAIDSAGSDRDNSDSPLFASGGGGETSPLFEMDDDDGPSAFERLDSGGSGGSSGLFEQTASDDGPSVFEEVGDMDDDDGPSAFERLDSGGGGSSGLLGEMDDDDGPSAFEKLDGGDDSGGLIDRLDDDDSTLNDVYK
jgi:hypothetical protein